MYGVFRHVKEGLVVRDLRNACEVNRKLRAAGDGYELLAVRDSLPEASERRRELRAEFRDEQRCEFCGEEATVLRGFCKSDGRESEEQHWMCASCSAKLGEF